MVKECKQAFRLLESGNKKDTEEKMKRSKKKTGGKSKLLIYKHKLYYCMWLP